MELEKEEYKGWKNVIANYLKERCKTDVDLKAKIEANEEKDLSRCFNYITSEAKKTAEGNCAVMSDEDVFNLAVHYFLEDGNVDIDVSSIREVKTYKNPEEKKAIEKEAKVKKVEPKKKTPVDQMSLFDFLEENNEEEEEENAMAGLGALFG